MRLSDLRGKNVVLIFYPGDDTPVCRKQLCEVRDRWKDFETSGTAVLGVNPQSAESHEKFRTRYKLPFPLLIDTRQRVAALYKAKGLFAKRTVYLIGRDGIIRFARRGRPLPERVLAAGET